MSSQTLYEVGDWDRWMKLTQDLVEWLAVINRADILRSTNRKLMPLHAIA
jgi:hypothetical protein